MKKRTYLAVLAACAALALSACGNEDAAKKEETKTETAETETAEKETAEETDGQEEAPAEEEEKEEKPASETTTESGGRLVSVDDPTKYITLAEYKGITLENTIEEIDDESVEYEISQRLLENPEEVKNGTVEMGDIATIDYVGTRDGEEFEGGSAEGYDLEIGSGSFIEGFEDGVVGMKTGETKDIDLSFPEDYWNEELAGVSVTFRVTVQKVSRAPELTDDWVAANSEASKTVEEYKEEVKKELQEEAVASAKENLNSLAWEQVLEETEVKEYPEQDLKNQIEQAESFYQAYVEQSGMTMEEFLESQGMSQEEYDEQNQMYAEYKVKQNLIVQAIMDAEGFTLDDARCQEIQEELMSMYGYDNLAEFVDEYGQEVDETIGLTRVLEFIVENADIKEQVIVGDTIAESGDENEALMEEIPEDEMESAEVIGELEDIDPEEEILFEEEAGEDDVTVEADFEDADGETANADEAAE